MVLTDCPRVEDSSVRYVAEENITILEEEIFDEFKAMAGQHFKRWDKQRMAFISNVRDEYPDD